MSLLVKSSLLPDVSTFFDDFFDDNRFKGYLPRQRATGLVPAANVVEDEKEFLIELSALGLDKKDFRIKLEDDRLIISADKRPGEEQKEKQYSQREFGYHSFSRSFIVPAVIDREKIAAKYQQGVLEVHLPKRPGSQKENKKEIRIG